MPSLRERLADAQKRAEAAVAVAPRPAAPAPPPRATSARATSARATKYAPWCIFARRARCCARKFECRRFADVVRVVSGGQCGPNCPVRVERLRISAVITAFNEGQEVARTLESLAESVAEADLEIVLVDDGSSDGSCDAGALGRSVRLLRHEEPQGVGRSRNDGWSAVRRTGGDVVSFHDAHMRFQRGGLEALARRALQSECFVCAGSNGLEHQKGSRLFCCDLFYNRKDGLQPKWLYVGKPPAEEWTRSPAPMGAGYVMSRATAERLEAATGTLWDDTAGRWGFSEQALAVKAFLLGIPVLFGRDVVFRHLYRGRNPVRNAGTELWKNATRCTALLFGREAWEKRFKAWCVRRLGERVVAALSEKAFRDADERGTGAHWVRPVEEVFTHLCGKHATVDAPHPEHAWLREVEAACRALAGAQNVRVLQWRPGESTMLVRRLLPDAQITAIEMKGHRADNWWDICRANDIKLLKTPLGPDYVGLARKLGGPFDLVLVGGEMQDACTRVARDLLAPGGQLIANPAADRMQIEDNELKAERKTLAALGKKAIKPTPAGNIRRGTKNEQRTPSNDPSVTVVLLNWRRAENFGAILDCLAGQTLRPQVYVWDNGGEGHRLHLRRGDELVPITEHDMVDLAVQSGRNLGCFPRWALAALADTEFVCSLDDDLLFADPRVLEDAVAACREECPDGIVGFFGWSEVEGKDYRHGRHHNGTTTGTACDIVKGRFMLFRRELLARVPLDIPGVPVMDGISHREDDVYVSLCISGGRRGRHRIPARLGKRWKELPQRGASAAAQAGHWQNRDRAIRAVKAWLAQRREVAA